MATRQFLMTASCIFMPKPSDIIDARTLRHVYRLLHQGMITHSPVWITRLYSWMRNDAESTFPNASSLMIYRSKESIKETQKEWMKERKKPGKHTIRKSQDSTRKGHGQHTILKTRKGSSLGHDDWYLWHVWFTGNWARVCGGRGCLSLPMFIEFCKSSNSIFALGSCMLPATSASTCILPDTYPNHLRDATTPYHLSDTTIFIHRATVQTWFFCKLSFFWSFFTWEQIIWYLFSLLVINFVAKHWIFFPGGHKTHRYTYMRINLLSEEVWMKECQISGSEFVQLRQPLFVRPEWLL